MHNEDFYPSWLYKKFIEDSLPWSTTASLELVSFLEKYTLHDSFWVGIFNHVAFDNSVTLAFQWDAVWLPDEVKARLSPVGDGLYLFIKLVGVKEVRTENYIELSGVNRAIAGAEIMDLDGVSYLAVDDIYGGQVNVEFTGKHFILALKPDCTELNI